MCENKLSNIKEKQEYINIQTGEKLDWERVEGLKDNAMLKVRPNLWCEWDFEKNNELGIDIWEVTVNGAKKVYWICKKCNSSYLMRLGNKVIRNHRCTYCSGRSVNHTNSLDTLNPDLAKEWHPTKNDELTTNDVTCGTKRKVWWLGKCGHEWETMVTYRAKGTGCPFCSKGRKKVLVGFNDMWTTNPQLASLLVNPKDGYKYTKSSDVRVNWKCLKCHQIIKNKKICKINLRGLSCPTCSDGISYPEKFISSFLKQCKVDYIKELSKVNFEWCEDKRYDFYIPSLNMIIEVHGMQHYEEGFRTLGGDSLEKVQENDSYKMKIAKDNGINHYVVIDCRYSDFVWVKESVINSSLNEHFDMKTINWKDCHKDSLNSLVVSVCKLWNRGDVGVTDIARILGLSRSTVRKYLKRGSEINICDYSIEKSINNKVNNLDKYRNKSVVNLDTLETFSSIKEASLYYGGISNTTISMVCKRTRKTAGGYKWMYKEDYDKYIADQNKSS